MRQVRSVALSVTAARTSQKHGSYRFAEKDRSSEVCIIVARLFLWKEHLTPHTSDWLDRTPSTCQGVASIPPSETSFPRVRRLQLQLPFFGGEGDGVRRRVGTRAKNLQLELQRQRPADSDAFVPKHLSLSPAMAVGVISTAAVQSLCSLTASVLHDEKIRLHALVHSQARQTDSPDLLCTLRLG